MNTMLQSVYLGLNENIVLSDSVRLYHDSKLRRKKAHVGPDVDKIEAIHFSGDL